MKINHHTNHFGEDLYAPIGKTTNRFFDVSLYGTTLENPAYKLYHNPHGFHVFEYVLSGKGFIHTPDGKYEVGAGDFYFLRQGFVGHYGADKEAPYKKIFINITGTMIDDLANMFGIYERVLVRNLGTEAESIIRKVHATIDSSEGVDSRRVLGKCSVGIYELLSLAVGCERIESAEYRVSFSERVKQYINGHQFEKLDLDQVAKQFHVNSSYLIRKFKRETGMTPMRYYNICRIDAARSLLSFNQKPVKEVAAMLNYSDSAYFSNRFKIETGYAPSEYTKEAHISYENSKK